MSKQVGAVTLGSVATPGKRQDAWENVPQLQDDSGNHTGRQGRVRQASEVILLNGNFRERKTQEDLPNDGLLQGQQEAQGLPLSAPESWRRV